MPFAACFETVLKTCSHPFVVALEASIADASLEAGEKTKEVLKLAFLFLAWVVHGNAENQQLAHDQNLEEIVDKLGEDYFAALPLAEIFRGNMKLVKQFPTRLVGKLIEYAVQAEHDPAFLEVLSAVTKPDSQTNENNVSMQLIILQELTSVTRIADVMFLCATPSAAPESQYHHRQVMMVEAAQHDADGTEHELRPIDAALGELFDGALELLLLRVHLLAEELAVVLEHLVALLLLEL